jgi:hypothetical protein
MRTEYTTSRQVDETKRLFQYEADKNRTYRKRNPLTEDQLIALVAKQVGLQKDIVLDILTAP